MKLSIPITKIGQSINVDTDRLVNDGASFDSIVSASPNLVYVLTYGLTQSLNDAHASPKITREQVMGVVQKKLDSIYAGTIKTRGSNRAGGLEPIPAECARMARAKWEKIGPAEQGKIIGAVRGQHDSLTDTDDAGIIELILAAYAKDPATVAAATATVAAKAAKAAAVKAAVPTIDLAALGLVPTDESDDESDDDKSDDDLYDALGDESVKGETPLDE